MGWQAIAGDILMVLGHHFILDMARLEKPMIGFIWLPPSVCPVGWPAVVGDILKVLGHHLILDMTRLDRPIIGFIQLQVPVISRKGKIREPV